MVSWDRKVKPFGRAFPKADSLTSLPRFYEEKQKQWKNPLLSSDDTEEKALHKPGKLEAHDKAEKSALKCFQLPQSIF